MYFSHLIYISAMEMEFIKSERNSKTEGKNEIFEDLGGGLRIIGKHEIKGEFKTKDETEEDFQVKKLNPNMRSLFMKMTMRRGLNVLIATSFSIPMEI